MGTKVSWCLVVISISCLLVSLKAFSSSTNFSSVSVSSNKGQLIFFDESKGQVYVYGQANGRFLYAWKVGELGTDLVADKAESVWQRNLGK